MNDMGYYNGRVGPIADLSVPMDDRGGVFGDGVYDATMGYGGIVVDMAEHLERFFGNLEKVRIPAIWTMEELSAILTNLTARVDAASKIVYWQATRGTAPRRHAFPDAGISPNLWVTVRPLELAPLDGKYRALTLPDVRYEMCHIKTINLLPNVLAAQEAAENGCDEAILVRDGLITEGARSNIHVLMRGVLQTAPCDHRILPGIARKHLLAHARQLSIPVLEEAFDLRKLMMADEIIMTNSASLCCSIRFIDGQPVGGRDQDTLGRLKAAVHQSYLAATGQTLTND